MILTWQLYKLSTAISLAQSEASLCVEQLFMSANTTLFCTMKNKSMATLCNIFIFTFVDVNKWLIWGTYMKISIRRNRNQHRQMLWCVTDYSRFSRLFGSAIEFQVSGILRWYYFVWFLQGTRDSVVVTVTRLAGRPWQLRNRGSFPGRGNVFLYSPTGLDRLKGPFIELVLEVRLPGVGHTNLITHLVWFQGEGRVELYVYSLICRNDLHRDFAVASYASRIYNMA
jgi:hypothetical protein